MNLLDKTIDRLKAFEPEEGYYGAFSGGKDSQVLYHVAQLAGVNVDWHFQGLHTPEDVLKWWISGMSKERWIAQEAQQLFCFDN